MTSKEIETRIRNLEQAVSNLANRTSNRDNTNESNISSANSEINQNKEEQSVINTSVEDALCEIYEELIDQEV